MNVLGLGGSSHDLSACVVRDGRLSSYIEEERLNRKKHSLGIGLSAARCLAADYCVQDSGLSWNQVHAIVGNDILTPIYRSRFAGCDASFNHHLCHAASALFTSGFSDAAILVVDGYGSALPGLENHVETISTYYARNGEIQLLGRFGGLLDRKVSEPTFENSIGGLYLCVTRAIGFSFLQEGKTMGLSAYGTSRYVDAVARYFAFSVKTGLLFSTDDALSLSSFIQTEIHEQTDPAKQFQVKADFAHAIQYHTEGMMVALSKDLYERTSCPNLCVAGGVGLNSVANWKIETSTSFTQIHVPPFCGDAGTAVGAAMLADIDAAVQANALAGMDRRPMSPYLGRSYDIAQIDAAVASAHGHVTVERPVNLPDHVATCLTKGMVIGFWQGKSEAGPRALGHRSILADPRDPDMKSAINDRIKHREPFRPFAPVVLEDHQSSFFECETLSPYMLKIAPLRPGKWELVPAIAHVDGTARLQTVSPDMAPELSDVLRCFFEKTGVPILLNTSFNDNGEPIVETAQDAVDCFLRIDLDMLVVGPYCMFKLD